MSKQKKAEAEAVMLTERCIAFRQTTLHDALERSPTAKKLVDTFDVAELPCVLFVSSDPCAASIVASHWVHKRGPVRVPAKKATGDASGKDDAGTAAKWWKYPHYSCIEYIEADMMAGNPAERALFIEHLASVCQMPHVSQEWHVMLLHNIEYLSTKSIDNLVHTKHGRLVATTSRSGAIGEKLVARSQMVRVACATSIHGGISSAVEGLLKTRGTIDDFRKFAHETMKLCTPTGEIFRALATVLGPDISPEMIALFAAVETSSLKTTVCPHAIEAMALNVYMTMKTKDRGVKEGKKRMAAERKLAKLALKEQ